MIPKYTCRSPLPLVGRSGSVCGLVIITPASGFVDYTAAFVMGVIGTPIVYFGVQVKVYLGYDDALDAFGVHCVGGIVGALLTGVFANTEIDGGVAGSVLTQLIGVATTLVYSFVVSIVLLKIIDVVIGLRVTEEQEREGLDLALHGERVE